MTGLVMPGDLACCLNLPHVPLSIHDGDGKGRCLVGLGTGSKRDSGIKATRQQDDTPVRPGHLASVHARPYRSLPGEPER